MGRLILKSVADRLCSLQQYIADEPVESGDYVSVEDVNKIIDYIKMTAEGEITANKMYDIVNSLCGGDMSRDPEKVKWRYIGSHILFNMYDVTVAAYYMRKLGFNRCVCYHAEKYVENNLFSNKNFSDDIEYVKGILSSYNEAKSIKICLDTSNGTCNVWRDGVPLRDIPHNVINKWITEAKTLIS